MSFESDDERTVISPRIVRRVNAAELSPGTVLGHTYRIEQLVSRGGIGEIYRARHVELGSAHALKMIRADLADDPKLVEMLVEEARKLARVGHDAIVNYQGLFRDEQGSRYLVMEFVEGEKLSALISRRRLEPSEVLRLGARLAGGLAAAHDQGIVHRDVSPKNILVPDGDVGRAKLIGFGIAQPAADSDEHTVIGGALAAEQNYAAPEQLGLFGGRIDVRTDIYRLGLVLAAAALGFGKTLDMGSDSRSALAARQRAPDLSGIAATLRPVIAPMLEPNPEDRPAAMRALFAGSTPRAGSSELSVGPSRRMRLPLLLGGGGAAVLAAGIALVLWLLPPRITEPELRAALATATSGYSCAAIKYETSPDRSVHVTGNVSSQVDLDRLHAVVAGIRGVGPIRYDVGVVVWPHCELAALLAPLLARPGHEAASLTFDPAVPEQHLGDRLAVDVRMPDFDGYVSIDYFASDGQVLHLFPNQRDMLDIRPAYNRFVLFRPPLQSCWAYSGEAGRQLIAMVVTPKPLFAQRRSELENARDYLPALVQALAKVPQDAAAAAMLFVDLHAGQSSANADAACPSG